MLSRAFYGIFWGSVVYVLVLILFTLLTANTGEENTDLYSLMIHVVLLPVDIFILYCLYQLSSIGKNFSRAFWVSLTISILLFIDVLISIYTELQSDSLYTVCVLGVTFIFQLASTLFLCNGITVSAKEYNLQNLAEAASYRRNYFFWSIVVMLVSALFVALGQIHPIAFILFAIVYLPASLVFFVSSIMIVFLYRKAAFSFDQVEQAF